MENVFIGVRSVLLRIVTVIDNSVIGDGSVVTKDMREGVLAMDNPTRVILRIQ